MASKSIIATRMALLAVKKRIKLAGKGHKLLKEKRDALIGEFFSTVDRLRKLRAEAESGLAQAFQSLILAEAIEGAKDVERSATVAEPLPPIELSSRTVMGIKVPVFRLAEQERRRAAYSAFRTSVELDAAASRFSGVLFTLVKVAELETAVRALAEDIKRTKRKVNALERILLPRLEEEKVYITMRLEEMERETFGRLKIVKSKMAK